MWRMVYTLWKRGVYEVHVAPFLNFIHLVLIQFGLVRLYKGEWVCSMLIQAYSHMHVWLGYMPKLMYSVYPDGSLGFWNPCECGFQRLLTTPGICSAFENS